jgi:hypothetical protein
MLRFFDVQTFIPSLRDITIHAARPNFVSDFDSVRISGHR